MYLPDAVLKGYNAAWLCLTSRWPIGTNVFDRDWDLPIVLDASRVDALRAVAPEYDFLDSIGSILSVGSTSAEWVAQTFCTDHLDKFQQTA